MNDTILNKKISIERCIVQIEKYYAQPSDIPFHQNYLLQDAIAMNLQRIGELAIDIAITLLRKRSWVCHKIAPMPLCCCIMPV